jgi:glycosyltransferase involved in cell wall biosynthesis
VKPKVTFVVPCYKLAHLLPECIQSILGQSYTDLEVLIMDDCSPDNTPEVAATFKDARVKHVRNEPNLGHLRNYNKGIGMAQGDYIWLISADDRLRRDDAVKRYVEMMEAHPEIGYIFCPGHGLLGSQDTGLMKWTVYREQDEILKGRNFLKDLLEDNFILAPSGLVRRTCYERHGAFPEDMPYGGDWYLWCLFAIHYDVGYLAEAMVDYRVHDLSMTNILREGNIRKCVEDDLILPWRIRREAERVGAADVVRYATRAVVEQFSRALVGHAVRGTVSSVSINEIEERLAKECEIPAERAKLMVQILELSGDRLYWKEDFAGAKDMYWRAIRRDWTSGSVLTKGVLASAGRVGLSLRRRLAGTNRKSQAVAAQATAKS